MKYKAITLGFLIACARFLYKEDKAVGVTHRTISSKDIPESFDGYKMIHVSDFHNARFGRNSGKLLKLLAAENGDIILMTGDIIDRRTPNLKRSVRFIKGLTELLPVYYVTGNHEAHYRRWPKLRRAIEDSAMVRLKNKTVLIQNNGDAIKLAGIDDPWFFGHEDNPFVLQRFKAQLMSMLLPDENIYTILMSHRPELFQMYRVMPVNLVLSGHAHGGQIRLPYVKGLYAPHQGILPKYAEGTHEADGTVLSISRGLGNSRFPFRVFNHPEIVVITLKRT